MITNTHFHTRSSARAHQNSSGSLWSSLGVAVVLTALTVTALGTQSLTAMQVDPGLSSIQDQQPATGWESSVPPDLLPLGALAPDTSR